MSVKSEVLRVLEVSRERAVSGQEIAERLQVSRAAVWKSIKTLQKEGYLIHATNNKGYQMDSKNDILSTEGIISYLSHKEYGTNIQVFKSIDSTNTYAKRIAVEGAVHGSVILSEEQTAGRGRLGRNFYSPAGKGVYMSFVLRPKTDIATAQMVTVFAAVAVCRAIERLTLLQPQIKWVNDIFLDGKKVCGILCEAVSFFESGTIESIVLGIGVNISEDSEEFPEELQKIATSLSNQTIQRNQWVAAIIEEIMAYGNCRFEEQLMEEYKKRTWILGKMVGYQKWNQQFRGMAKDINELGNLIVQLPNGEIHVLNSGEVSVVAEEN